MAVIILTIIAAAVPIAVVWVKLIDKTTRSEEWLKHRDDSDYWDFP